MTDELKENVTFDGTPWLVLLTIVLLVGKVAGWWGSMSWLWVFSPLWLPFAFVFGIVALLVLVMGVVFLIALIAAWLDK